MARKSIMNPELLQEIFKEQAKARQLQKPACFLFNRVSTKKDEQETSLEQQEHDSFAYAAKKGFHVVYNFRVQETASKEEERHAFMAVVSLLKSELVEVSHLVFKSADRSSRNRADKDVLDRLRRFHGVSIHYYSSRKVLDGKSHYTEELQDDIENLFATHFARELSFKLRAAVQHKVTERRTSPVSRPPFGYKWDKNAKQHVIDREAEGPMRAIFAAFDSGNFSLSRLCEYLNERNMHPASGIDWTPANLRAFLVQPFYCGRFRHRGEVYDGTHEPYFSVEEYERRVERLSRRRSGPAQRKNHHPLDCLLRCPDCNRHFFKEFNHRPAREMHYLYYKHHCPDQDKDIRFREGEVWAMLDDAIEAARFSSAFADNLKSLFEKPLSGKRRRNRREKEAITARIEKLSARKARLLDLFSLEEISQEELLERRREYESQIVLLKQNREALSQDAEVVFENIAASIDSLQRIPEEYQAATDSADKVRIFKELAEGLIFEGGNTARINWKKPFDILMTRPEIQQAIELDRIEAEKAKVFKPVHSRLAEYTEVENSLPAVQQMIVDFKLWLASR